MVSGHVASPGPDGSRDPGATRPARLVVLKTARPSASAGGLLGVLLVLGWCLHDLAVFLTSGRPAEAAGLVPGWLVALALGGLLGAALSRAPRLAVFCALVAFAAALLALQWRASFSSAELLLPREIGLLLTAWLVATRVGVATGAERRHAGAHTALALGILACVANARLHHTRPDVSAWLAGAAVVVLVAGFLRRASARLAASALALSVVAFRVGTEASSSLALPRPDLAPPVAAAAPGARSLVLIVLDTVRADHLGFFGHTRDTTPRIDAFAREHARAYRSARSTSSETIPSHASLFSGLQPKPAQLLYDGAGDRPGESFLGHVPLAERLRESGYRTGAVLSNGMLAHQRGLDRGFERYDDRPSSFVGPYLALGQLRGRSLLLGHKPYRTGALITDEALAWLDSLEPREPFLLVVNYMDAHGPYIPEPPYDRFFGEGHPRDPLVNDPAERELYPLLYDRELRYLDDQVGRFLDGLVERGLFDDSVVILTADHGEAFGEHGLWVHGWMLYDELIHVPLFVKPSGARSPATVDEPTSGADVYRIALEELGLEPPPPVAFATAAEWNHVQSRPDGPFDVPLEEIQRDVVTWLEGSTKFIVSSKGKVEAYDLARDPDERSPLPLEEAAVEAARRRAEAWWKEYPRLRRAAPKLDADTQRRLEELGYAETSPE
jgi:arylsulfatase A-like enzyme